MAKNTAKKTDPEVISVLRLFLQRFLQASLMYIVWLQTEARLSAPAEQN